MKINIRKNVFETNSSSVHNLCIVSKEEFEEYKKGELIYDNCDEKLVKPTDELRMALKKQEAGEELSDDEEDLLSDFQTYENLGRDEYETFEENYKTKNGDEIVAFGYHGNGC